MCAASIADSDGAEYIFHETKERFPRLHTVLVDQGYKKALWDFPWSRPYLGMCSMPATESPVAFQVQGDALKQMLPIEETETAALEYLDLIVQTLDKATTQPLTEVVGNPVEPGIQQGQEGRV